MNDYKILTYTPRWCIGTRDLNGCTEVVIQSPIAIILAHISPRPGRAGSSDPHAGDRHMANKMDDVIDLYQKHSEYFPTDSTASAVYAWIVGQSQVALPDQKAIVERKLAHAGLRTSSYSYEVPTGRNMNSGRGTVHVGWVDRVDVCDLFVEDTCRKSLPVSNFYIDWFKKSRDQSSASSSATPASSGSSASASTARISSSAAPSNVTPAQRIITILQSLDLSEDEARQLLQHHIRRQCFVPSSRIPQLATTLSPHRNNVSLCWPHAMRS